jgi:hypothetical protein
MFSDVKIYIYNANKSMFYRQSSKGLYDFWHWIDVFECRMRFRKTAIERALSQKIELYGHKVKQTALCIHIWIIKGPSCRSANPGTRSHLHSIRSTCDQSRRITTAWAPAPVGCQGRVRDRWSGLWEQINWMRVKKRQTCFDTGIEVIARERQSREAST